MYVCMYVHVCVCEYVRNWRTTVKPQTALDNSQCLNSESNMVAHSKSL
jgi:hypothetical protein